VFWSRHAAEEQFGTYPMNELFAGRKHQTSPEQRAAHALFAGHKLQLPSLSSMRTLLGHPRRYPHHSSAKNASGCMPSSTSLARPRMTSYPPTIPSVQSTPSIPRRHMQDAAPPVGRGLKSGRPRTSKTKSGEMGSKVIVSTSLRMRSVSMSRTLRRS
jgi:hypothetical protein